MYIPQAPHTTGRTKDLTSALRATIDAYQLKHPKTSAEEIRAALEAVTPGSRYTGAWHAALLSTIVFFIGVFIAIVAAANQAKHGEQVPWILMASLLVPALTIVIVLWLRTRDS